ncbi:MAG: aldo/keto reductase [Planctomycetes bacterium]|nr:aldo/keto reductase [Planctomycetota bacterium]
MRKCPFGPTGMRVPVIGQGTWMMERDRAASVRALRAGLDAGMTHVDTAEMYGDGAAEELVGEAIAGRRDKVFLVSKVLPRNAGYEDTLAACDRSLRRLRTDHLDLYLLHWREQPPLEPTLRAFDALMRAGKIRHFGVSNFDVGDLEEAHAIDRRIACNQVLYHLKERAIEHAVIPWCERHGLAVVAYSPYGEGNFPTGSRTLREIARARSATPRQVALAFMTRRPSVFAIPKSSDVKHVLENAGAGDLRLTDEEIARIDKAHPAGPPKALPMI